MNLGSGRELFLSFLALGPVLVAQAPRRPRGIYAVVHVETYVNQQQQANPSITQAQLDAFFNGYCQDLRNNPAISGITLQMGWKSLNPNPPTSSNPYFWNYVDDAFAQVAAWNSQNSTQAPKTIQFIVSPGFSAPPWLVAELPSCDGLFQTPVVTPLSTKAGDSVALFGTGFGPTNPPVAPGQEFSGAAPTTNSVTLRINNASVTPTFAGLSGAGLYQINLTIPAGLGTGDVPLQATVGGVQNPSGVVISLQ